MDPTKRVFLKMVGSAIVGSAVTQAGVHQLVDRERLVYVEAPKFDVKVLNGSARAVYVDAVLQRAEKAFPESKPYLEAIASADYKYHKYFDLPPEYFIAMLYQESRFDPFAISSTYACGISQFMKPAAEEMGLATYDISRHPELQNLEIAVNEMNDKLLALNKSFTREFDKDQFDKAIEHKMQYNALKKKHDTAFRDLKKIFIETIREQDDLRAWDGRFVWEDAIPAGRRYIGIDCKECQDIFGGRVEHNIYRGIAAYNAGLKRVYNDHGIAVIKETIRHINEIMKFTDMITPEDLVYKPRIHT